jgi:hypothetical protein
MDYRARCRVSLNTITSVSVSITVPGASAGSPACAHQSSSASVRSFRHAGPRSRSHNSRHSRHAADAATPGPPLSHNRPLGFRLSATFSPSRRQIHSTWSLPTRQPACCSSAVIRRISITAVLAGQCNDGEGDGIVVLSLCRSIALRGAWLLHQKVGMALGHPVLSARTAHDTTSSLRAQNVPEAMSFNTSFSRLK